MTSLSLGVVPIARNTFDVPLAEQVATTALATLDGTGADIVGPRELLFDGPAVEEAITRMQAAKPDLIIVLQVTFADASMTAKLAEAVDTPILLWAFPEARDGGRLRLNSFCGINLAGHALGKRNRSYGYIYAAPDDAAAFADLPGLIASASMPAKDASDAPSPSDAEAQARAEAALVSLKGRRIGVAGDHPVGFDTCEYTPEALHDLMGLKTETVQLDEVFAVAKAQSDAVVNAARARVDHDLVGAADVEQEPLEKSLRVYGALKQISEEKNFSGMAVRCWPEFFTEYGCAACGAMGMMGQDGTPAGCEADVYGNATTLLLQALVDQPVFVADLVDIDMAGGSDTGVMWHCGLAPLSMADPDDRPEVALHSNRKKPLLAAFALKPGRITIARLSQARGETKLVIGGGEMIRAPRSFSGTSGVVKFDRSSEEILATVMGQGLEHHYCFAYGDVRAELTACAEKLGLKVLEL